MLKFNHTFSSFKWWHPQSVFPSHAQFCWLKQCSWNQITSQWCCWFLPYCVEARSHESFKLIGCGPFCCLGTLHRALQGGVVNSWLRFLSLKSPICNSTWIKPHSLDVLLLKAQMICVPCSGEQSDPNEPVDSCFSVRNSLWMKLLIDPHGRKSFLVLLFHSDGYGSTL